MSDLSIRPITVPELAELAAQRTAKSGVIEACPFQQGSADHRAWKAAYESCLLAYTAPEYAGGAA